MQVDQHATDEVVDQVAKLPEVTVVHRGVEHDPVGGGGGGNTVHDEKLYHVDNVSVGMPQTILQLNGIHTHDDQKATHVV